MLFCSPSAVTRGALCVVVCQSPGSGLVQCLNQLFWGAVGLGLDDIYYAGLATSCDIYQYLGLTGAEPAFP